jgi:hypothetical protein
MGELWYCLIVVLLHIGCAGMGVAVIRIASGLALQMLNSIKR